MRARFCMQQDWWAVVGRTNLLSTTNQPSLGWTKKSTWPSGSVNSNPRKPSLVSFSWARRSRRVWQTQRRAPRPQVRRQKHPNVNGGDAWSWHWFNTALRLDKQLNAVSTNDGRERIVLRFQVDAADSPFLLDIITTQHSVLIADTRDEKEWSSFKGHTNIRSWLCVPLVASEQTLGLLSVGHTQPNTLTEDHLRRARISDSSGSPLLRGSPTIGLALEGGSTSSLNTAAFDNVAISSSSASGAGPSILSLSPSAGTVGSSIVITGTSFGTSQGDSTVSFNGVAATQTANWSDSQVVTTVPAGAAAGPVTVTVNGLVSNQDVTFTLLSEPSIESISPASGPVGTTVIVNGTNFGVYQASSSLSFNGVLASSVTSWSDTSIIAVVPSSATNGPVTITVNSIASNSNIVFTVTKLSAQMNTVTDAERVHSPAGNWLSIFSIDRIHFCNPFDSESRFHAICY